VGGVGIPAFVLLRLSSCAHRAKVEAENWVGAFKRAKDRAHPHFEGGGVIFSLPL